MTEALIWHAFCRRRRSVRAFPYIFFLRFYLFFFCTQFILLAAATTDVAARPTGTDLEALPVSPEPQASSKQHVVQEVEEVDKTEIATTDRFRRHKQGMAIAASVSGSYLLYRMLRHQAEKRRIEKEEEYRWRRDIPLDVYINSREGAKLYRRNKEQRQKDEIRRIKEARRRNREKCPLARRRLQEGHALFLRLPTEVLERIAMHVEEETHGAVGDAAYAERRPTQGGLKDMATLAAVHPRFRAVQRYQATLNEETLPCLRHVKVLRQRAEGGIGRLIFFPTSKRASLECLAQALERAPDDLIVYLTMSTIEILYQTPTPFKGVRHLRVEGSVRDDSYKHCLALYIAKSALRDLKTVQTNMLAFCEVYGMISRHHEAPTTLDKLVIRSNVVGNDPETHDRSKTLYLPHAKHYVFEEYGVRMWHPESPDILLTLPYILNTEAAFTLHVKYAVGRIWAQKWSVDEKLRVHKVYKSNPWFTDERREPPSQLQLMRASSTLPVKYFYPSDQEGKFSADTYDLVEELSCIITTIDQNGETIHGFELACVPLAHETYGVQRAWF